MFQFFNFSQKLFLFHVNLFLFIPAFPACYPCFSGVLCLHSNKLYKAGISVRLSKNPTDLTEDFVALEMLGT